LTKNEKPGSILTFGGYNVEKFAKEGLKESDVKWFEIDKQNMQYWSIPMGGDQISLGSGPNSTAKISSSNVILDSGLSYALIPSHDIKVMMQLLNDKYGLSCARDQFDVEQNGGNLAFPTCSGCNKTNYDKVEDFKFKLGGQDFVMPKSSFLHMRDHNKFSDEESEMCNLVLAQSDMDTSGSASGASFFGEGGSQNWLLGD